MSILKFQEQVIDHFHIPSFTLAKGEMVVIQVPNLPHSFNVTMALVDIFTGKVKNDKAEVISPLTWAGPLKENWFRYHFLPTTVGAYLTKYANKQHPLAEKIYEIEWMIPQIKIKTLAGNPRKRLALYKTLSWTNNIAFDLAGIDLLGSQDIYSFIEDIVQSGGAAILFDWSNHFKDNCSTHVEVKYLGDAV